MSEKCKDCVDLSDIHWPKQQIHKVWAYIPIGCLFLIANLPTMLQPVPEGSIPIGAFTWIRCIAGTGFGAFLILYSLYLLFFRRGLFNYWRYDVVGETIYVSLDVEERLHIHRQETMCPPPIITWWRASPCLLWSEVPNDAGRTVKRGASTILLGINLAHPKKCDLYINMGMLFWGTFYEHGLLYFKDRLREGTWMPFPTDSGKRDEKELQRIFDALKRNLVMINQFKDMAEVNASAVRPEADEPKEVAGSINPSAS